MKYLILLLIHIYRYTISPLIGPCCRFNPTCSQYGLEVIQKEGALRGMGKLIRRLLRCHPYSS